MPPTHSEHKMFCNLSTGKIATNSEPKMMSYDTMTVGKLTSLLARLKRNERFKMIKIEVLASESQEFGNCADPIEVRKLQLGTSA